MERVDPRRTRAMKIHQRIEQEARLRSAGEDLAAQLESLFTRCPALSGFAVRVEDGELFLTDVGISLQLGAEHCDEIFERIAAALFELLDERPEAAELLRGRTFARTLH
jgi:hypothetical protein